MSNTLFSLLQINNRDDLRKVSKKIKIKVSTLEYYYKNDIIPTGKDLEKILIYLNMSGLEFNLRIGNYNNKVRQLINNNISQLLENDSKESESIENNQKFVPIHNTEYGTLYNEDSLNLMKTFKSESFDLIFADPPFNLNKEYESKINDYIDKDKYLKWTYKWLEECVRLLKPGGSIFVWNLPKWNIYIANYLGKFLDFRNWIAVDMKYGLPIKNRLYPAHYSLLYFVKGPRPNTFNNERIPLDVCNTCGHELKDYGGYKNKMNPKGVNLSDVWHDIYPVRHKKYKNRKSNELPIKLLDRIISMSTQEGDTVFDPFGGSGTTYVVAEILHRKWVGSEIGPVDQIINRLSDTSNEKNILKKIHKNKNHLFLPNIIKLRKKNNFWLPSDFIS